MCAFVCLGRGSPSWDIWTWNVGVPLLLTVPCDTPLFPLDLAERLHQALLAEDADLAMAAAPEGDGGGDDEDDGDGRSLQSSGVGPAAKVEAVETGGNLVSQHLIKTKRSHAPSGLRKVQTTAGGMLRHIRRPLVAMSLRLSRRARGTGGLGP